MRFASRIDHLRASAIRELFDLGRRIPDAIDLSIGQVGFGIAEPIQEAVISAIRGGSGRYSPTEGFPDAVEAVRRHLMAVDGLPEGDDVMLTVGATGALTLAFLALAGPGDEVLIPDPHFVIYRNLAHIVGATPVFYDLDADMQPDPEVVASKINDKTRLLVLNNPANPTGCVFSHHCVESIAQICEARGVPVVSDELHSRFIYGGEHVSVKRFGGEQSLLIGGLSKTYGVSGWRLGWAAGPPALIDRMRVLQQFTYTCPPTLAQAAVPAALACDVEPWVDAHRRKRDMAWRALVDAGYELARPGGTIFMFPKVPRGTDLEFCARALDRKLILVPGRAFSQHNTHFRLSIGANEETLLRGLEVLVDMARD